MITPLPVDEHVRCAHTLITCSHLERDLAGTRVFGKQVDLHAMQLRSGRIKHRPISQQRDGHRSISTTCATFVDPVADHTSAHGAITDRSQRNLADDTPMLLNGEHHSGAVSLVAPHRTHPLIERHRRAMQRVSGFPRLQPVVITPTDVVPFVAVVEGQRPQDYGNVEPVRLNEPRNIDGIGFRTHHAAQRLQNRHAFILPCA